MADVSVDILEDGLLYMINATIFHPRGFALAKSDDKLVLLGDGSEAWVFQDGPHIQGRKADFEALLDRAKETNRV